MERERSGGSEKDQPSRERPADRPAGPGTQRPISPGSPKPQPQGDIDAPGNKPPNPPPPGGGD